MDSKVLLLIWRRWWKNHLALRDEGWTVEWNTNDPYGFVLVIKDVCDAVWIDNKRSTRRIFYSNPFLSNGLHLCCIWHQDFSKNNVLLLLLLNVEKAVRKKAAVFFLHVIIPITTSWNQFYDFLTISPCPLFITTIQSSLACWTFSYEKKLEQRAFQPSSENSVYSSSIDHKYGWTWSTTYMTRSTNLTQYWHAWDGGTTLQRRGNCIRSLW